MYMYIVYAAIEGISSHNSDDDTSSESSDVLDPMTSTNGNLSERELQPVSDSTVTSSGSESSESERDSPDPSRRPESDTIYSSNCLFGDDDNIEDVDKTVIKSPNRENSMPIIPKLPRKRPRVYRLRDTTNTVKRGREVNRYRVVTSSLIPLKATTYGRKSFKSVRATRRYRAARRCIKQRKRNFTPDNSLTPRSLSPGKVLSVL